MESNIKFSNNNEFSGQIVDITIKDDYQKIVIKKGIKKVIVYDKSMTSFSTLDYILVKGDPLDVNESRIPGMFNYKEYLKHNKTISIISSTSITKLKKRFNLNIVRELLLKYVDNSFSKDSKTLLKALIIGNDDDFSDSFKTALTKNGILHLFAISGSHISLFVIILDNLVKKYKIRKGEILVSSFLFLYIIITNFQASVVRAVFSYYLVLINKKLNLKLTTLDVISIGFILLLIYNPYYMYNVGFVLSYIMTFTIVLFSPLLKNYNNIKQIFVISLLAFIVTLPITINMNNEINILSPLTNVLFIFLVEEVIMPVSFIIFLIPPLSFLYNFIATSFINITLLFSKVFIINVRFPTFSIFNTIIYYLILVLIILFYKNKTYKKLFILIYLLNIFVLNNILSFNINTEVVFLDLYNGESILIKDKINSCNALIDTGDNSNDDVLNYLKHKGIKRLDFLFLTHNHDDHNGQAINIINNFSVNNIVVNAYDNSELVKSFNVIKIKNDTNIKCGSLNFFVIAVENNSLNENDNSLIIHSRIGNKNFLFLGDASIKKEESILKYNFDVDIIKIAHHGSKTSTSEKILLKFKPETAIIQTGRIKKFGFPHQEVINSLNKYNIIIYRTDYNYTITYVYKKNKSIIKSMR